MWVIRIPKLLTFRKPLLPCICWLLPDLRLLHLGRKLCEDTAAKEPLFHSLSKFNACHWRWKFLFENENYIGMFLQHRSKHYSGFTDTDTYVYILYILCAPLAHKSRTNNFVAFVVFNFLHIFSEIHSIGCATNTESPVSSCSYSTKHSIIH